MPLILEDIELHMGPRKTGAPDDLEAAIVGFIGSAKKTLDIAVQEIDSKAIAEAILEARQKGVRVRLVLEMDYLMEKKPRAKPWEAGGPMEANRGIRDAILRSAAPVWADFNGSIFHQKFIIRDGSALLTGSTNFTTTCTTENLNHVVIVKNASIAKVYAAEFKEIMDGHFGNLNEGHDPKPREFVVSDVPVKVLFAPDHNPEMEIMKQMLKAKKRIDFAIFTFAQSSGIDDAMVKLKQTGISIQGVFDRKQANQKWAATHLLNKAKIPVFQIKQGSGVRKLHHKLMVIDQQVVVAGSFNYTGPANQLNDENIIVLGDLETESAASREAQRKLARYAFREIERIIEKHGEKIPAGT